MFYNIHFIHCIILLKIPKFSFLKHMFLLVWITSSLPTYMQIRFGYNEQKPHIIMAQRRSLFLFDSKAQRKQLPAFMMAACCSAPRSFLSLDSLAFFFHILNSFGRWDGSLSTNHFTCFSPAQRRKGRSRARPHLLRIPPRNCTHNIGQISVTWPYLAQ